MERPQVLSPEISEMVGERYGHLLHQASAGDANGPLGLDELRHVVQIQVAGTQRSVAQTWTPNSCARKMDDRARPQPKSNTRMPACKVNRSLNHSAIQSGWLPIPPSWTHAVVYFSERGNRRLNSCVSIYPPPPEQS